MRDKKLVIFDMDGTLMDSSRVISGAINHVRDDLGLPPMEHRHIISHINDHSINPAKFFYEAEHFVARHEELFGEYYSKHHQDEVRLYDGVEWMVDYLHTLDVKLAIATNAYRNSTIESLRHFGLLDKFDTIVCADDLEHPKPAPDMIYHILSQTGIERDETAFVGDGVRDEEAAMAAGVEFWMVDWGFSNHHDRDDLLTSIDTLMSVLMPDSYGEGA